MCPSSHRCPEWGRELTETGPGWGLPNPRGIRGPLTLGNAALQTTIVITYKSVLIYFKFMFIIWKVHHTVSSSGSVREGKGIAGALWPSRESKLHGESNRSTAQPVLFYFRGRGQDNGWPGRSQAGPGGGKNLLRTVCVCGWVSNKTTQRRKTMHRYCCTRIGWRTAGLQLTEGFE